jgi:hypothetical protein
LIINNGTSEGSSRLAREMSAQRAKAHRARFGWRSGARMQHLRGHCNFVYQRAPGE